MQVLLIISNPVIKDLVSINLKTQLGIDVISRANYTEALDLLTILPEIHLIIASDFEDESDALKIFTTALTKINSSVSLIILSHEAINIDQMYHNSFNIIEDQWEEVITLSTKILGVDKKENTHSTNHYTSIPIDYFYNIETSCCDVYIRINKGKANFQYVKRIHQGDTFSKEVIARYQDQGLKHFFVPADKITFFSNFVSNQLVEKLNKALPLEEKLDLIGNTYDVTSQEISRIGFNSATIQLTESLVQNILETMKTEKKVSHLLRKIINSKTGYIYQHGHLTTIVASEIITALSLDGDDLHLKIAFAAIFKDISLVEHQELAAISSIEDLEKAQLDEDKWDLVFNHAIDGAILIRQFPDAPLGVDDIIKHHHGAFTGKGFPAISQESKITEIALIFLISVEFVNELLRFKVSGEAPRPIVDLLYKKYTGVKATKIIKTLEANLKKNLNESKK